MQPNILRIFFHVALGYAYVWIFPLANGKNYLQGPGYGNALRTSREKSYSSLCLLQHTSTL